MLPGHQDHEEIDGVLSKSLPRTVAWAPALLNWARGVIGRGAIQRQYRTRFHLAPQEAIVTLDSLDRGTLQVWFYGINFGKKRVASDRAAVTKVGIGNFSLSRSSEYIVANAELEPGDVKLVSLMFELRPDEIARLLAGDQGIPKADNLLTSPHAKLHLTGRLVTTDGKKQRDVYFDYIFPTDFRVARALVPAPR